MAPDDLAIRGGPRAVPEGTIRPWPEVDEADRAMVLGSLAGTNHAHGPNCKALEKEFCAWQGCAHALSANSGTAALHMALYACGVGAGDEVLVPAYTWPSSATVVIHQNAIPVFVDINWETMNMDEDAIAAAVTPRTKAIIVVHLHGLMMDMDRVMAVAKQHHLRVIEDACQAQGALWRGRKAGSFGACAAFSFNQNKVVSAGEGGMMTTEDPNLAHLADRVRYFGEHRNPAGGPMGRDYALGWMYRTSDLPAAFARSQLAKLDRNLALMKENAAVMAAALHGTPGLVLPAATPGATHNWYNYTIRFDMDRLGHAADPAAFRDRIVAAMLAEGVDTLVWQPFILPEMTVFRAKSAFGHGVPWSLPWAGAVDYTPARFPVAKRHADTHTGMTTPLRPPNGPGCVEAVARGIRKVMERAATIP